MKKIAFLMLFLGGFSGLQAQDMSDAFRFSSEQLNGTARYVSMSGAFGALGGDISAIKDNPAGSAVFLTNFASLSLDLDAYKNKTDFADGLDSYNNSNTDLSQAGIVFVFNNANESASVSRLSFGVSYNRAKSLKNRFSATGQNNNSVSDMFLDYAQGVPLDLFTPHSDEDLESLYSYLGSANLPFNNNHLQTAYLGYETFLFDPVDPDDIEGNEAYYSNVSGDHFDQNYQYLGRGAKSKLTFNGGLAINDNLYFGLNLNSHFIDYRRTTVFNENIPAPSDIREINFINDLDTKGTGFSFQVGGIARLGKTFRAGVSYESPTWFTISDQTTQFLRTDGPEYGEVIADPRVTNVYPDYHFHTPGKISGSLAAVFGDSGMISVDYSYQDFSNNKFTSSGFGDLNRRIGDAMQAVSTVRVGGEYRIEHFSLRAGYRYQGSAYKDETIGDLQGYSAGLGYNFGNVKLDFAYAFAKRDSERHLLNTELTKRVGLKNELSQYVLTLAFAL